MTNKKLIVYAVLTAVLAGIVTLVTWQMNGWPIPIGKPLTYVSFISWAGYFLFGASPKGALKAFTSIIAGIVAAVLMFVLSIAFGFAPWWAVPLAVTIMVIPMMLCEKVKPFNNVAAVFVGTGRYFSLSAAGAFADFSLMTYVMVGLTELVYVLIGFVAGWLTIQFNIWVSKPKNLQA
jgi:hypothetical protein